MSPTFDDGKFGLAVKTSIADIYRFDVVIVDTPNKYIVKRVIGLPGELVEYKDNILYINGEEIKDEYNFGSTNDFSIQLGENEYYVLGDNREHSLDSRYYGTFDNKSIKAVVI